VQVAEYFARRESGDLELDALHFESATRGDQWAVRFRHSEGIYEVALAVREGAPQLLTCKSEHSNPIPSYKLISFRKLV
jgi:hypothetical protein